MKITLAKFKKEEGKTPQNRTLTDEQQKFKELIERRNKTIRELKEIAQEYLEKIEKNSDDNGGGGGLPSGISIQIIIVIATAAITYFSQKEEEENKKIFSRLSELVAQYTDTANPSDTMIKEIRELVAKATKIKQDETGKGFADLIGKSGIGIITEIAQNTAPKGTLSDALQSLKKMQSKKSKDFNL